MDKQKLKLRLEHTTNEVLARVRAEINPSTLRQAQGIASSGHRTTTLALDYQNQEWVTGAADEAADVSKVRRLIRTFEEDAEAISQERGLKRGEQMARDVAGLIDHTALKPDTSEAEIRQLCQEGLKYGFASVCVNPHWVPLCAQLLRDSPVMVCTVVGFPLGATTTGSKVFETDQACRNGAEEVDMVLNIGALKSGELEMVTQDIRAVAEKAHEHGARLKVIIEAVLLSDEEKIQACTLSKIAGADFVKTSTGFSKGGATIADVALMRYTVGHQVGVKAAGGIRSFKDAIQMIKAGASRIGASAGVGIAKEARNRKWIESKSSSSLY